MLRHTEKAPSGSTVLVLGSQGFIGKSLIEALNQSDFKIDAVSSKDIDLTNPACVPALAEKIKRCDHIVFLSCLTPDKGKGPDVLVKNILMAKHVCDALLSQENRPHVVYFSSDAVYNFEDAVVTEKTPPSPIDVYGAMHRTRELMLLEAIADKLAVLRPSLVYGAGDTHNSYGPNRFARESIREGSISLFGEGEDTRAHVFIEDLVKIARLLLENKSVGTLNGAPDTSITYKDLATLVSQQASKTPEIKQKPRGGAPTHRHFDASCLYEAFPGFTFTPLEEGVEKSYARMEKEGN